MLHSVRIRTGARLHFGPLSYLPEVGRHFGGIGLMINEPAYEVQVTYERSGLMVDNGNVEELTVLRRWRETGWDRQSPPIRVTTIHRLPGHQGLGSGTQRALAVGEALTLLTGGRDVDIPRLAVDLGRGRRSAVGIYGYQSGGFIVDAGKRSAEALGQAAVQTPLPDDWRILLFAPRDAGDSACTISGEQELHKFDQLAPMSEATSGRLCRLVLTELLPALQGGNLKEFNAALGEYGRLVGEFFRAVQGGVFRSPILADVNAWLRQEMQMGLAQSSWGPTASLICDSPEKAHEVSEQIERRYGEQVTVCQSAPLNTGRAVILNGSGTAQQ